MRTACLAVVAAGVLLCGSLPLSALAGERERTPKPGVAFLMSLVLPGSGQLYMGNQRGFIYLGVEAAAWFTRAHYLDAGNKREGEYEAFARRHWSLERYRDSADDERCGYTASNDSLIVWFWENDPQQYYEEVGKYDKFRCGWDDFAATYDPNNDGAESPNRAEYRDMRRESNDLLDNARLALAALFLNRVVSGVDAFRTARARNRGVDTYGGLRLESDLKGSYDNPRAEIRLVKVLP